MDWLLIIAVTLTAGAEPDVAIVGHMVSRDACILAGDGMAKSIAAANPGASVGWKCLHRGVGA